MASSPSSSRNYVYDLFVSLRGEDNRKTWLSHFQKELSSSSSRNWEYDVFVSFRGKDVRKNFVSHFQKELDRKYINTFRDNKIEKGESIDPVVKQAIRNSKIAVVVFSENYASSSWCLDELVEIVKCKKESDQVVIPIFYGLEPTHVRKQTGKFGEVFKKTCEEKSENETKVWRQSLTEVANLCGNHPQNWPNDATMVEEMVDDILGKILVGMEPKTILPLFPLSIPSPPLSPFHLFKSFKQTSVPTNLTLPVTPISEITPDINPFKIRVRIVRHWRFLKKEKPEEFTTIYLLLVDDMGSRIQASVKGKLLPKFQKQLKEADCCVLMNFELYPNVGRIRSCSHPYKINFKFNTCVKSCEQIPNLEMCFNFCPFTKILSRTNDDSIFIDIIGEITGMNEVKNINTSIEGPTKLLNLQIKDLGGSIIDVALWGKLAEDVHSEIKSQSPGPIIFLGSLMKSTLYQGKGTVQSYKFTTKIYINSPLPEILQFQEGLNNKEPRGSLAISQIESSNTVRITKDLFSLSKKRTIAEVMEIKEVLSCNILASVCSIEAKDWFYIGCTICFTKATPYFNPETEEIEADKYSCEKCGEKITTTQPRYKVHVTAADNTGHASFILFDDVVIPLIKKSSYELLEQQVQFDHSGETPQELLDLVGRTYVLKIMLKDTSKYQQSSSYRVLSLTDVPDIIQSFSECASTLNALEPEMLTISRTSFGNSIQAENMSLETENLDNNVSESTLTTPRTKRSLPTSKDDDIQHPSTKPKLISSKGLIKKENSKTQIKKEKR